MINTTNLSSRVHCNETFNRWTSNTFVPLDKPSLYPLVQRISFNFLYYLIWNNFCKRSIIYINILAMDWGRANTSKTFRGRIIDDIFSCVQAALWMVQSVRPPVRMSVCLSVTPFSLCSHHHIIMKFSGVITNDRSHSNSGVKDQGHRGQNPT